VTYQKLGHCPTPTKILNRQKRKRRKRIKRRKRNTKTKMPQIVIPEISVNITTDLGQGKPLQIMQYSCTDIHIVKDGMSAVYTGFDFLCQMLSIGHQKERGCPGLKKDPGQGRDQKIDPPQPSISMMHTNTGERVILFTTVSKLTLF
jgi:hypothetical protein